MYIISLPLSVHMCVCVCFSYPLASEQNPGEVNTATDAVTAIGVTVTVLVATFAAVSLRRCRLCQRDGVQRGGGGGLFLSRRRARSFGV